MQKPTFSLLLFLLILLSSCSGPKGALTTKDDGKIEFVILQMNDVYEISPLENGTVGGIARVATIKKRLEALHENVFCILSGDFLSPSLIGSLKYQGSRIKGQQMVEALNALGLDLVTFGNHEFDLDMEDPQKRIDESEFEWLATTVRHKTAGGTQPFYKEVFGEKHILPDTYTWKISDADGTQADIGFFSTTINSNPRDYVEYLDFFQTPIDKADELGESCNLVLGVTHLERIQDLKLAGMLPQVPLLMGGHDHDHMIDTIGTAIMTKADANAKTVYIHRFVLDTKTGAVNLKSELVPVTDAIPADPFVDMVVQRWVAVRDVAIKQVIENPFEVVYSTKVPLDARESMIRHQQAPIGKMINEGMLLACKEQAAAAFFNSGSIRLDDQLAGSITPVDIFRTLPFGGKIMLVEIRGDVLIQTLTMGRENKGTGGYLQLLNLSFDEADQAWRIQGKKIQAGQVYKVAVSDFLLLGLETGLDFFTPENPGILSITGPDPTDPTDLKRDIRKAWITYLQSLN
ncbi:MAG: bifunctional metallophosphatase/5'-nucleotidase [Phaeodactylibacter sp.]|nr:bifunctional metallophosphatase/5'-nucleotidase [Phaeodactylibacter sp.]